VVDHLPVGLLVYGIEFAGLGFIDQIEKGRKGIAQIEAAAAAMADVEDSIEFLLQSTGVVEFRVLPTKGMARRRLQTTLPAWLDLSVRHD
jgi:hypothetical protein